MKRFKSAKGKQLVYDSYDKLLQMWGVNREEVDIRTCYGKTHAILAGNKNSPPLLLFHGVGDNSALMWLYNARELAKHFYIIAVDTIGGPGRSEPDENYNKSFEQSSWIDDVLNALKIKKVNIAGVSNGAYIAQYYAMKRPERVEKVVCMAGSVSVKSKSSALLRMLKVFLPEALFPSEKNTKKLLKKLCGPNAAAFTDNEELMRHWFYLLKYFNIMSMRYHKVAAFQDSEIDTIRNKALFLIGDSDRLTYHPETINALKDKNLAYKIIKNAGHGINHEQADTINKEIIDFIL